MSHQIDGPIYCLSYFLAKDGQVDELTTALKNLIPATQKEEGCLLYELAVDLSNANFLIMIEKFVNEKALAFHETQPYIRHFVEKVMNNLCEKVTWHEAKVITI